MNTVNFAIHDLYRVSFEAELEGEEWTSHLERASKALQKRRPLKGFRSGSAPLGLCEKEYGQELFNLAASQAANACLMEVCREKELQPVSEPSISVIQAERDKFSCLIRFDNYPDETGLVYKGLEVEKPVHTVTEEEIDAVIERFRHNHLYVHEVPREARMGDIAEVDFTGTCQGEPFPLDHSSKSRFTMGSGQLFAGLDEALVGHVAGDRLELSLTMPEDFHRQDVAGLTLDLIVNLHGVWARDLRELNDDFVKELVRGCETVAEYREKTRQELQKRADDKSQSLFYENIDTALAAALPVPVPASMVNTVLDRYCMTLAQTAQSQGKTMDEVLREEGKTLQDFRTMAEPSARKQASVSVAVDYIISQENFPLTREELDAYYARNAASLNITPEEVSRRLGGDEAVAERILQSRATQLVRDTAKAIEKPVDSLN